LANSSTGVVNSFPVAVSSKYLIINQMR
jgi:hypothetical protein